jgi:ribulose-phosphate 3-epimerase
MMIKVAPSILAADFSRLGEEIKKVEAAGADMIHIDVMDGHFVSNITIGPVIVQSLKKITKLTLEAHLMISDPLKYIDAFADAGADLIGFHIEAVDLETAKKVIAKIKSRKKLAEVVINPPTDLSAIKPLLDSVDMVLVMSVNPGFAGQSFIDVTAKIRELRKIFKGDIQVDGGINDKNAKLVKDAGANILAAASYIFKSKDYKEAIRKLKE